MLAAAYGCIETAANNPTAECGKDYGEKAWGDNWTLASLMVSTILIG